MHSDLFDVLVYQIFRICKRTHERTPPLHPHTHTYTSKRRRRKYLQKYKHVRTQARIHMHTHLQIVLSLSRFIVKTLKNTPFLPVPAS